MERKKDDTRESGFRVPVALGPKWIHTRLKPFPPDQERTCDIMSLIISYVEDISFWETLNPYVECSTLIVLL